MNLNSKLRRRGNISAYEINTARDQNTGENLELEDKNLRSDQLETRKSSKPTENLEPIEVGDTVMIKNQNNKHKARDMFIVTGKSQEEKKIKIQKMLHPLLRDGPEFPDITEDDEDIKIEEKQTIQLQPWNPIDQKFFHEDSDDDESDPDTNEKNNPLRAGNDAENSEDEFALSDQSNESNDLQWDSSPEQINLQATAEEELPDALLPRNLFEDEEDEVFSDFQTPSTSPPLRNHHRRHGAMRIENQQLTRRHAFRIRPRSEPRVTRAMLNSRPTSTSAPTTPSQVVLDRTQNLQNVLIPTAPMATKQE